MAVDEGREAEWFFESGPGWARKLELWVRWEETVAGWTQKLGYEPLERGGKITGEVCLYGTYPLSELGRVWGVHDMTQALRGSYSAELSSPTVHLSMVFHHKIACCFLHQTLASFTAQSRCYSSVSFSLFSVMALHPIYCSLFKPCSKDRIINFLMGCSSWALIITLLHK